MAELAPAEDAARRRLLFGYLKHFPTDAAGMGEFEKYLDDLSSFIDVSTDAKNQAINALHRRRREVLNPYGRPTKRLDDGGEPSTNPFTIADGTAQNPQTSQPKKSNAGRKRGTKNKAGHNAGGDRKSAEFWAGKKARTTAGSSGRGSITSRSSEDGDGGLDEGGAADDVQLEGVDETNVAEAGEEQSAAGDDILGGEEPQHTADAAESHKAALDRLRIFAENIPNGTFTTSVDCNLDDEGGGDGESDSGDGRGQATRHFTARKYLPVDGSPVGEYLGLLKARVLSDNINVAKTTWIPPPTHPVMQSLGANANPNEFYLGDIWAFVWAPMVQYAGKMPQKYECPDCNSRNTRINNWFWRPYHWWDRTVYVLHQQIRCYETGCRACYPTIHRKVLATLPTHVAERLPFVCPTDRGPGYYGPMLLMMVALMQHSVQSGTFARTINMLKHVNFASMHVSYLDEVDHWKNVQRPATAVSSSCCPVPFSPFADQAGFCGIRVTEALLLSALEIFMGSFESYMQAYFQFGVDEGCSSDDSHKLTSHIAVNVGKEKVKPFTTTYTVISNGGKVNLSRFKPTKSNDELVDIVPDWAAARANAGHCELLRLEGDNAAGDSALQLSASPSLLKGVVPYRDDAELTPFVVDRESYTYVTTREGAKRLALLASSHVETLLSNGCDVVRIALDSEYQWNDVHVISVAVEGEGGPAALIHPYGWGGQFEPYLRRLLEHDKVLIVGCNVACDVHKLRRQFGVKIRRVRDNMRYCLHDNPNQKTNLHDLGAEYLKMNIDKSLRRSNFNVKPPLAPHLQDYAMGDAIASLRIDDAITARIVAAGVSQPPPDLQPGAQVVLKIGGVEVAEAKLLFLGDSGPSAGQSATWGKLWVGAHKALVEIETVFSRRVKVPYQHSDWEFERTLGQVWDTPGGDRIIAVRSNQIRVRIGRHAVGTAAPPAPVPPAAAATEDIEGTFSLL